MALPKKDPREKPECGSGIEDGAETIVDAGAKGVEQDRLPKAAPQGFARRRKSTRAAQRLTSKQRGASSSTPYMEPGLSIRI
jgi:hypothetical protein